MCLSESIWEKSRMRPEQARSPRRRIRDLSVIYANETQGWSVAELTWLRGPRGEKRPADVIGNAVKVMRIATVEETEELETDRAKSAAAVLGSRGGKARAERMSPERRHQIAKKAAAKRWSKETTSKLSLLMWSWQHTRGDAL